MGKLRVEEPGPRVTAVASVSHEGRTADEWRTVAVQTGQRLSEAQEKLAAVGRQADELRARERKARDRADSASARTNDLQAQLVAVMADRDALRARVKSQDELKRLVWDVVKGSQAALEQLLASI